jgi:hypothetical protein
VSRILDTVRRLVESHLRSVQPQRHPGWYRRAEAVTYVALRFSAFGQLPNALCPSIADDLENVRQLFHPDRGHAQTQGKTPLTSASADLISRSISAARRATWLSSQRPTYASRYCHGEGEPPPPSGGASSLRITCRRPPPVAWCVISPPGMVRTRARVTAVVDLGVCAATDDQ